MTRTGWASIALLALLAGCAGTPEVTTYRETVDVCVTSIVPDVNITDRRPFFWRYHSCSRPTETIAAGAMISPSVIEGLAGAAGALGGGLIVGHMIGPSGHAAPKTITINP